MGFISKWFKSFEPQEYDDPELGRMISDREGNWNGFITLPLSGKIVPFSIIGAPQLPRKEQLEFIQQVRYRFTEVETELSKKMFKGIDPLNQGASPEEVFSHMKLTSIFFSNSVMSPHEWEIWYENDIDQAGHAFCVEMKNWSYNGFSING